MSDNFSENVDISRQEIENVIEQEVRPILRAHGGDLCINHVTNGHIRIEFTGACKACPSAQFTIEDVVMKALKAHFGEKIKSVSIVNNTDEEMLSFAKKLLSKK